MFSPFPATGGEWVEAVWGGWLCAASQVRYLGLVLIVLASYSAA